MCERTCPRCGDTEHFEGFGILGAYILCEGCGVTLAQSTDAGAARTDLTDDEADAWADERTWVLPGAEARNPDHDRPYTPRAALSNQPMQGEPICPVTPTGLHQKQPWQSKDGRSGLACRACHKTWTFHGDALKPTFEESGHGG